MWRSKGHKSRLAANHKFAAENVATEPSLCCPQTSRIALARTHFKAASILRTVVISPLQVWFMAKRAQMFSRAGSGRDYRNVMTSADARHAGIDHMSGN
jgi:hypothetical protein